MKPDGVSDEIEIDSDTPLLTIANQMTDVEEGIKLLHTGYDSSKSFTNKYFLDIDILKQVSLPTLVQFLTSHATEIVRGRYSKLYQGATQFQKDLV